MDQEGTPFLSPVFAIEDSSRALESGGRGLKNEEAVTARRLPALSSSSTYKHAMIVLDKENFKLKILSHLAQINRKEDSRKDLP